MIEPAVGFDLHSFAILLHILLVTYWLGSDLGVFYSSKFVVDPSITPAARATAMKIMHMVDLAPRVCLILMLPSGVTLMAAGDIGRDIFYGWPLVLAWVGSLAWLAIMLIAFFKSPAKHADLAYRADWVVRIAITVGLLAAACYALVVDSPFGVDTNPKWLAGKIIAYALCIFCGIMIRVALRPFGPAFGALMTTGSTPEVEAGIGGAMKRAVPWVYSIWVLVLIASFLGVFKPGTLAG
ncbi:hypothetical protein GHK92_13160 [Nocardioides sp. dk4132]|uniref:hypothetical protein n=1 Tax=unclassified Nocardioides TaxID=2615069 RepID=UPI001297BF20|nr:MULTISPECIES: hypothetical protein [unclassified Nocardioides]MQW76825.1 hypothetical protein [Nocardioides sp. dk4132]QGA06825.1 hypothetical protein GFH29_05060 [Nocardioides sp. dk884]